MKLFLKKPPWYATGLAFECQECGRCCAGPEEGYVWVTEKEMPAIAEYLGISEEEFRSRYVRKVSRRFSFKECPQTHDCIFLQPNAQDGKGCAIYPVRPTQCRTWPFWASNLADPDAWALAQSRCIGINRGKVHSLKEIDARQNVTRE